MLKEWFDSLWMRPVIIRMRYLLIGWMCAGLAIGAWFIIASPDTWNGYVVLACAVAGFVIPTILVPKDGKKETEEWRKLHPDAVGKK